MVESADRAIVDKNLRYCAASAAIHQLSSFLRITVNTADGELDDLGVEQTLRDQAKGTELGAIHFDFRQCSVSLLCNQYSIPEYGAAHAAKLRRRTALKTTLRQYLLSTSQALALTLSVGKQSFLRTPFLNSRVSKVPRPLDRLEIRSFTQEQI